MESKQYTICRLHPDILSTTFDTHTTLYGFTHYDDKYMNSISGSSTNINKLHVTLMSLSLSHDWRYVGVMSSNYSLIHLMYI